MRKWFLLIALLLSILAWAQSPFDGTWTGDLRGTIFNQDIQNPIRILVKNGIFQHSGINIRADGTDQPTPKSQAFDLVSAKVVDDKTIEMTGKKGGRVVELVKFTASAGGKTCTGDITMHFDDNKPISTSTITFIRIDARPSGSHAMSGTWKPTTYVEPYTFTCQSSPNGLIISTPDGKFFAAKFDGKDYPIKGAVSGMTVSLKKVNDHTIVETDKIGEKTMEVFTMRVSADGKTLTIQSESKELGRTTMFTGTKQ